MACDVFSAFATATQSLGDRILRYPRMDRPSFWKNLIPSGTFKKNTGVQQTTFTMAPSYPTLDPDKWTEFELSDVNGQPTPGCDTNFSDVELNYYDRLYNPKQLRTRGPVLCREQFTFQHNIGAFLNGYVRELARSSYYELEFGLRGDYMKFADWFSFTNGQLQKYSGPNAQASVGIPTSPATQDMMQEVALDAINTGVGTDENGYVVDGDGGPVFPWYIDQYTSNNILRNNSTIREDARFASMGKDGKGDTGLFGRLLATRIIGNGRHVPTNIAPRFNNVGGQLVEVTPFKTADQITPNGDVLTGAYKAARYEAMILAVPSAFTAEWVTPYNWQFPDAANYMGEWEFLTGAERICTPPEYDPQHNKGRHFGNFKYAPRPDFPWHAKILIYKRCVSDLASSSCPSYT